MDIRNQMGLYRVLIPGLVRFMEAKAALETQQTIVATCNIILYVNNWLKPDEQGWNEKYNQWHKTCMKTRRK